MAYNTMRNSSGFQGDIESGFSPELNGDIPGNIVLGIQGPPGGYYTPSVSQPDASTMRIRYNASKGDMPGVNATDVTLPPGPKGDPFTFEDFTPEQLGTLRGPKGEPFTYDDFTPEQLESLRGEPGVPGKDGTVSFDELTEEQRESLRGDPFTYEDFTAEQLAALKGEPGYTPQKGIDYFDGQPGYTPRKGIDYFDGNPGYTPQKGIDYFDGKNGRTPQIELLNVVQEDNFGNVQNGVSIKATNANDDGTESVMLATVWDGKNGAPGDDYVLTPADKTEIAEMAAELVEVPSGGGIAVTGATVGQTVKISAVDENGVPTAWESVDFPSGGGGAKWALLNVVEVTDADVLRIDVTETADGVPLAVLGITKFVTFVSAAYGTKPDYTNYMTDINGKDFDHNKSLTDSLSGQQRRSYCEFIGSGTVWTAYSDTNGFRQGGQVGFVGRGDSGNWTPRADYGEKLDSFSIYLYNGSFKVGTKIMLWGC